MSRGVSSEGAGIGTAPMRMAPSRAVYQAGTRGSISSTRSPGPTPRAARAFPARRESATSSATVWLATGPPAASSDTSATASGSSSAQRSRTCSTELKRSGTSIVNVARSRSRSGMRGGASRPGGAADVEDTGAPSGIGRFSAPGRPGQAGRWRRSPPRVARARGGREGGLSGRETTPPGRAASRKESAWTPIDVAPSPSPRSPPRPWRPFPPWRRGHARIAGRSSRPMAPTS